MKTLMKKILLSLSMLVLVGLFSFETIAAARETRTTSSFSITSGYNYGAKSTASLKTDSAPQAYIDWTSSSEPSHKEWFRVVNSGGDVRSDSFLFNHLEANFIDEYTSCLEGFNYYLQAAREHITNPRTTVKGTWET